MPLNPRQLDFSVLGQGLNKLFANKEKRQERQFAETKEREQAMFQDSREAIIRLENKDYEGVGKLLQSRIDAMRQHGGNPEDTVEIRNMVNAGQYDQAINTLKMFDKIGVQRGYLSNPLDEQIKQAQLAKATSPQAGDKGSSVGATVYGRDDKGNARVGNVIFDKETKKSRVAWADGSGIEIEKLSPQEKALLKIQEMQARSKIKNKEVDETILTKERQGVRLGYLKEGRDAKPAINNLDRILSAIDLHGTGKMEEFKRVIGPFIPGIDPTDPQAMTAILNKGVFPVLAAFTGAISEGEREFAAKTVANLGNTPEANKIIISHMKRALQDKVDARDQFIEWEKGGNKKHELFEFTPIDAQQAPATGGFKILSIGN